MVDFINLIRNENMKIYRRPRTWVMVGFIFMLILIISAIWAANTSGSVSIWDAVYTETDILYMLVTIFVVVVASSGVAEEFSGGTIKLLLIRPWSRSKILLSKYLASVLFAVFLSVVMFAAAFLINWICFGLFNPYSAEEIVTLGDGYKPITYLFLYFCLKMITLLVIVTLAFMISTVFRSSILAISISLFLLIIVNTIVMALTMLDYAWIDYLLFSHLSLVPYLIENPRYDGSTLGFSLSVLGVYYVVFLVITWYVFNKRDVAS